MAADDGRPALCKGLSRAFSGHRHGYAARRPSPRRAVRTRPDRQLGWSGTGDVARGCGASHAAARRPGRGAASRGRSNRHPSRLTRLRTSARGPNAQRRRARPSQRAHGINQERSRLLVARSGDPLHSAVVHPQVARSARQAAGDNIDPDPMNTLHAVMVTASARPGMMSAVTKVLADHQANIRYVDLHSAGDRADIYFEFELENAPEGLFADLKRLDGVLALEEIPSFAKI